jgi:pimeloyl-ACP methyl ester carboxylesterase
MGVSVVLAYLSRADACVPNGLFLLSGSPALDQTRWFSTTEPQALRNDIAERERRLSLREAADHDAVAWTWQAISPTSQLTLLPSIAIPTRILHGSADGDSPPQHAEWLRQGLPNASLCMLEGAGHGILTAPSSVRVAAEIRQFIHRQSLARTTAILETP